MDGRAPAFALVGVSVLTACRGAAPGPGQPAVALEAVDAGGADAGYSRSSATAAFPADAGAKTPPPEESEPWKIVDPASDANDVCGSDMSYGAGCSSKDPTFICSLDAGAGKKLQVTVCHPIEGYWALQYDFCRGGRHMKLGEFNRRFQCAPSKHHFICRTIGGPHVSARLMRRFAELEMVCAWRAMFSRRSSTP